MNALGLNISVLVLAFVILVLAALCVGALFVGAVFLARRFGKMATADLPYVCQDALFTPAERSFLGVLDSVLPPDQRVMGKVRLADLIAVRKGLERAAWQRAFNRIQSKHIDFVICRAGDLSPLLLIELDDSSHNRRDRQDRDAFVDAACQAAGLPILHLPAKRTYHPDELRETVRGASTAPAAA